jgi:xylan 1,4-beta-xylosidase
MSEPIAVWPAAEITVAVDGLPVTSMSLRHYRMDADHSNAYAVWQAMGSPQTIEADAYRQLEEAGKLALIAEEPVGSGASGEASTCPARVFRCSVSPRNHPSPA